MARSRSPKYPNYALAQAIENIDKVHALDRTSMLPREVIAKHLGYSGLSGASDTSIATLVQYGLLEKVAKGEMRVSSLAVDILLPENEHQKAKAIVEAASKPPVFSEINEHFNGNQPSTEALRTYLLRREFHDRAIEPIIRSYIATMEIVKKQNEIRSGGLESESDAESPTASDISRLVSASVGDLIQWESQGALQFETPRRVRWVSEDGDWLAVEGSDTGIPMSQIIVEQAAASTPPVVPPQADAGANIGPTERGFSEWFRAKVGAEKIVTINFKGDGEIGPKEIEKMIRVLEAQKIALEDD